MAKAAAAEVDAGGRAVRVSSPDRIIFEATRDTAEVTKQMVAEYFVSVGDGIMRALRERPTALERQPSGVRERMRLATGPQEKTDESLYQKRLTTSGTQQTKTPTNPIRHGHTARENH